MRHQAKIIATILAETDSQTRGNLLCMVAEELQGVSQYFTAKIIHDAALAYGVEEQNK